MLRTGSAGYGDHGYIKMQRGVGKQGLCCINCMPQYAISIRGPPPTPTPPPPPRMSCNVSSTEACIDTSGFRDLIVPGMRLAGRDSDRLSLESCGAMCSWNWTHWTGTEWAGEPTNETVASIREPHERVASVEPHAVANGVALEAWLDTVVAGSYKILP